MRCCNLSFKLCVAAIAAAGWLTPSLSSADNDIWKTAASGTWSAGANWVDGSTPDSVFDSAAFNQAGTFTVSFNANPDTIGKLSVNSGNVTFASSSRPGNPIVPRTLRLSDAGAGDFDVGLPASLTLGSTTGGFPFHLIVDKAAALDGTLNLNFGSTVNAESMTLGQAAGSSGRLNLSGGSSVQVTDTLRVGGTGLGTGTLSVLSGARVESPTVLISSEITRATATVSGVGSTWIADRMQVGFSGSGQLRITDGGVVEDTSASILVFNSDSIAALAEVIGPNSRWTHQRDMSVGPIGVGTGTLSITDGGLVENLGADANVTVGANGGRGTVHVTGSNSRWINASDLKVGTQSSRDNIVNIFAGGFVQNADAILGDSHANDRGTVIVSGPGSQWLASSVIVGNQGRGTLKVLAGGRAQVASTLGIGVGFGVGEVTVDGPGSELNLGGVLTVAGVNQGNLNITGGGRVSSSSAILAQTGLGSVVVAGAGSTWDIGDDLNGSESFFAGSVGTLRIQLGGAVNVGDAISLDDDDELRLEGGALRARSIEFLGAPAQEPFFWSAGRLSVDEIQIDTLIYNSGNVLAPGRELGETFIDGDLLAEPGGVTEIQIGGTTPGVTFDRVRVTGNITITNGALEVSMLNGFVPSPTDAFTVMSSLSGMFTGSFGNIPSGQRLATSDGVGSFLVSYGPGSPQVVLSAFQPGISGDFDVDGDVDGADFLKWQRGGSPHPNSASDLAVWRGNFAFTGSLAATDAVPEPCGGWLAILAISLLSPFNQFRRLAS